MTNFSILEIYLEQIEDLKLVVKEANDKITSATPDDFVYRNANFFTKSFLVIVCAYIESYIKDILVFVINDINSKLAGQKLPHNLIKWSFSYKDHLDNKELKYEDLKIKITKNDLDKFISANPFLAIKLFANFGINLMDNPEFVDKKDIINSIVLKRNKVVHHNDDASDLSFNDMTSYITTISNYLTNLNNVVLSSIN